MKASTTRFFNLIISLVLFFATVLVFGFFIRPEYEEIGKLRAEAASRKQVIEDQKKIINEVKGLLGQFEVQSGPRQAISQVLPNREEYPALVNQLRTLAELSGLRLANISIKTLPLDKPAAENKKKAPLPVVSVIQSKITFVGSYEAFKAFTSRVETNIRLFDIELVSISPAGIKTSAQDLSFQAVINAYYQTL